MTKVYRGRDLWILCGLSCQHASLHHAHRFEGNFQRAQHYRPAQRVTQQQVSASLDQTLQVIVRLHIDD